MPQTDMAVVRFEGVIDEANGVDKTSAEVGVIGKRKRGGDRNRTDG